MKAILKNTNKYKDVKFDMAKVVDLNDAKISLRFKERKYQSLSGISTGTYAMEWFHLGSGKAIFKTFDQSENAKNIRMVNELLCCELAKSVNIPCAKYEVATKDNNLGVVSYDVTKPNSSLISGFELFKLTNVGGVKNDLRSYVNAIKKYKQLGNKVNIDKAIIDLYKIVVFDFITAQTDRHMLNLFFHVDKQSGELSVAEMIDNEFAFFGGQMEFILDQNEPSSKFIKMMYELRANKMGITNPATSLNNYAKQIVDLAQKNVAFKNALKQVMQIDVKSAFTKLEKQGVSISPEYKEFVKDVVESNCRSLKRYLSLYVENTVSNV